MASEKDLQDIADMINKREKKKIYAVLGCILAVIAIPFFTLYHVWAWAIVIQYAWAWFAVPTFEMVALTFPQAIAVTGLTNILFAKSMKLEPAKKNEDGSIDWLPYITAVILPWVSLLVSAFIAWIFI
jgi:hypothetical protein